MSSEKLVPLGAISPSPPSMSVCPSSSAGTHQGYVGKPTEQNKYQPFLNKEVALELLFRVFDM